MCKEESVERWHTVAALLLFDLLGHLLLDAPSPLALHHLPTDFLQYEYSTRTFRKRFLELHSSPALKQNSEPEQSTASEQQIVSEEKRRTVLSDSVYWRSILPMLESTFFWRSSSSRCSGDSSFSWFTTTSPASAAGEQNSRSIQVTHVLYLSIYCTRIRIRVVRYNRSLKCQT